MPLPHSLARYIYTADGDYSSVTVNRSIAGGSQSLPCIQIDIADDAMEEGCTNEDFGVILTAVTQRVVVDGGNATVYIVDDDQLGGNDVLSVSV